MIPLFDVVTFAIAVVLQADDGHEVAVCEFRIEGFDFVVQGHVALRARKPSNFEYACPLPNAGLAVTKNP